MKQRKTTLLVSAVDEEAHASSRGGGTRKRASMCVRWPPLLCFAVAVGAKAVAREKKITHPWRSHLQPRLLLRSPMTRMMACTLVPCMLVGGRLASS